MECGFGLGPICAMSVTGGHVVAMSVTGGHILAMSVTGSHFVAASVAGGHVIAAPVTNGHFVAASVTGGSVVAVSVTGGHFVAASVAGAHVVAASVTGGHVVQLKCTLLLVVVACRGGVFECLSYRSVGRSGSGPTREWLSSCWGRALYSRRIQGPSGTPIGCGVTGLLEPSSGALTNRSGGSLRPARLPLHYALSPAHSAEETKTAFLQQRSRGRARRGPSAGRGGGSRRIVVLLSPARPLGRELRRPRRTASFAPAQ